MKIFLVLTALLSFQIFASDAVIIDVRTPGEFNAGHIENSINIEWQEIEKIKDSINKNQKIYVYSRSGNRSQKATDILIKIGYDNVENLGSLNEAANFLQMKIIK